MPGCCLGEILSRRERLYGAWTNDTAMIVYPSIQEHLTKDRQVARISKQPGMGRDPTHRIGVLIMNLALQQVPPPRVILGWRDLVS